MSDFKNQSPWGSPPGGGNGDGFRRGPTPPDIDEIVKNIQDKIKKFFPWWKRIWRKTNYFWIGSVINYLGFEWPI